MVPGWDPRAEMLHDEPAKCGIGASPHPFRKEKKRAVAEIAADLWSIQARQIKGLPCIPSNTVNRHTLRHCASSFTAKHPTPLHKETPIVSLEASSVPVFLGHGMQDDHVKFEFGQQGYKLLQERGVTVNFKRYPMEHIVCEDELRDMASFLGKVLPQWLRGSKGWQGMGGGDCLSDLLP
jgi:hypothetical protein